MNAISPLQSVIDDDIETTALIPSAARAYGSVSTPAAGSIIQALGGWCVFSTHPQAERLAVAELARAGYRAYLPLIAVHRRDPVVKTMVHVVRVPLFSGYGFVWVEASWVPIRYTPGVRDLLMNGTRPASVPTSLVERLQAEDAERCQLDAQALPRLNVGASVVVSEGPMESLPGVVISCDGLRTQIRLSLFGRMVPVWLNRSIVEPVA